LFIRQIHSLPSFSPGFISESGTDHLRNTLGRLAELPVRLLLGDAAAVNYGGIFIRLFGVLILATPIVLFFRKRETAIWSLWLLFGVCSIAILDLLHHSSLLVFLRYTMIAGPGLYAIVASINWPQRKSLRDLVAIAIIGFQLILNAQSLTQPIGSSEDWRLLSDRLNASAVADEPLVFYSSDPWVSPGMWYMAFRYYHPESNRPWMVLTQPANQTALKQLRDYSSLRAVHATVMDASATLPGWKSIKSERTSAGKIEWLSADIPQDIVSNDASR
jgi:hypothetical protein